MENSVTFTYLPIRVEVWGLPFDLFSEEVRTDIGKGLGCVVDIDSKSITSDRARFLQIRVEIPLDKPIHRGSKIQGPEGDTVWIAFKYESVGMKRRHKENDEDDSAEINGAYKKQKSLEDSIDIPSTVGAVNQPRRTQ